MACDEVALMAVPLDCGWDLTKGGSSAEQRAVEMVFCGAAGKVGSTVAAVVVLKVSSSAAWKAASRVELWGDVKAAAKELSLAVWKDHLEAA